MQIKPAASTSVPFSASSSSASLFAASGSAFGELLAALEHPSEEAPQPSRRPPRPDRREVGQPGTPAEQQEQQSSQGAQELPLLESLRAADLHVQTMLSAARAPQGGEVQVSVDPTGLQAAAQEVLRQVAIQQIGGQTTLQLELEANRLSRLSLQLQLEKGRLNARFWVEDEGGLGILRAAAGDLERALQEKGVAVGTLEFARRESAGGSVGSDQQQAPHSPAGDAEDPPSAKLVAGRRSPASRRPGDLVI